MTEYMNNRFLKTLYSTFCTSFPLLLLVHACPNTHTSTSYKTVKCFSRMDGELKSIASVK